MKRLLVLLPLIALAGCAEGRGEVARPARAAPAPPIPVPEQVSRSATPAPIGPEAIRGQNARTLIAQFGPPRIDMQEGPGRKLQFAGSTCVLDIYLYPQGRSEAVATHVETRLRDGRPVDTASCVATLRRP